MIFYFKPLDKWIFSHKYKNERKYFTMAMYIYCVNADEVNGWVKDANGIRTKVRLGFPYFNKKKDKWISVEAENVPADLVPGSGASFCVDGVVYTPTKKYYVSEKDGISTLLICEASKDPNESPVFKTPISDAIAVVPASTEPTGLGSKTAGDLQSADTVILPGGRVEGTLKYVSEFNEFASNSKGNYFFFKLGSEYDGKEATLTKTSGENSQDGTPVTIKSDDHDIVLIIPDNKTTAKITAEGMDDLVLTFVNTELEKNGEDED